MQCLFSLRPREILVSIASLGAEEFSPRRRGDAERHHLLQCSEELLIFAFQHDFSVAQLFCIHAGFHQFHHSINIPHGHRL